jgi:hypothetical protein
MGVYRVIPVDMLEDMSIFWAGPERRWEEACINEAANLSVLPPIFINTHLIPSGVLEHRFLSRTVLQ